MPPDALKLPVPEISRLGLERLALDMVTFVWLPLGATVPLLVNKLVGTLVADTFMVITGLVLGITMPLKPPAGTFTFAILKLPPDAELSMAMFSV